jgi:hypothetical protein
MSMGMKSNSRHFSGTNGAIKAPLINLNLQLFASKYKTPTEPNMVKRNLKSNKDILENRQY